MAPRIEETYYPQVYMVALKWLDIVSVIVHINNFQMVALKCPDQELEATVERWQEWDLGETRHEVIAFINIYKHLNKSSW